MRKKILCLFMAAALSLGAPCPAYAEDHEGSRNWKVQFDGSKMNSNFSSSDLAEEISSIQPGDSIRFQVLVENSSGEAANWYMTNQVLSTLEDQSEASGGSYTYQLVYVSAAGVEDVLYSSDAVGGEESEENAPEGLRQATDSLEDFFFLDTLDSGQQGTVYLTVKLDGESQGNAYQDTLAQLQMNFAVEQAADPVEVTVTPTPIANTIRRTLQQDSRNIIAASVQTNDPTQILPYCLAALAAGAALLVLGAVIIKKRRGGPEEEGGSRE